VRRGLIFAALSAALGGASAWAQESVTPASPAPAAQQLPVIGIPHDGGIDLQTAATPIAREIQHFHNLLLPVILGVSILVLALLLWVVIRYNRRANPTPRKFTHNMTVEVIWTIAPVIILVVIASQSFPLLFHAERIPPAELTIKVTGNSWFWQYEYQDAGVNITSVKLEEADAAAQGKPYLLGVDNPLIVPANTNVRLLVTSNDVIHAWAIPAFGVKEDAIQGRVNDAWFNVDREGVFYGQCSELCGINHAFMPIEVHAVSREEFARFIAAQGGSFAFAAQAAPAAPAPVEQPAPGAPTR